jgi:hypothetical protein
VEYCEKQMTSALETFFAEKYSNIRSTLTAHDRGVTLGLILACIPLSPTSVLGLVVSLFNLHLYKNNRLEHWERNLIISGLLLSITNIIFTSILAYYYLDQIKDFEFLAMIQNIVSWVSEKIWYLNMSRASTGQVI